MITKKCKKCGEPLYALKMGLRSFCSKRCQKSYRLEYKAKKMHQYRYGQEKTYLGIKSTNVDNISIEKQRNNGSENRGSETYSDFGGEEWFRMAEKKCPNFQTKRDKGYCVADFNPNVKFSWRCDQCLLGINLMERKGLTVYEV